MTLSRSLSCLTAAAWLVAAGVALAQTAPPSPAAAAQPPAASAPPKLEPLPEIPPPPGVADADLEPQVTIKSKDGETVEEARVNGRLVWIKVTPRHGRPYFLVPDGGGNVYIRRDSLDTGLRVPLWVLFEF